MSNTPKKSEAGSPPPEESTIFTKPEEKKANSKKNSSHLALKLVIIALVIVGLGAGTIYFYPRLMSETETTSATSAPEIHVTGEMDVTRLKITNPTSSYTISSYAGKDEEGKDATLWKIEGLDNIPQSQYMFSMLLESVQSVIASKVMEEADYDLAEYGLDTPETVVEITQKDGSVNTLKVGAPSPDKTGSYVTATENPKVFLVTKDRLENFLLPETKYVETTIIPALETKGDNDPYFVNGELTKFDTITLSGSLRDEPLVLEYDADESTPIPNQITSPVFTFASDERVSTLLGILTNGFTSADAYVINYTDADLKKYNLDVPQSVITWKVRDTTVTMKLSEYEEGYYAGLVNDNPVIYKITESTAEFFDWQLSDVRNNIMFAVNIIDVKALKVTTPAGSADFQITNSEVTDEDGDTTIKTIVTNNAASVRAESFQNFYAYLVAMPPFEFVEYTSGKGDPVIELEYTYTNGKSDTVAYYKYNDRFYLYTINGKGDALIQYSKVDAITTKFQDVLAGKDVTSD